MRPARVPGLTRTLVVLALVACVSGLAPFLTQALSGGVSAFLTGSYEDPCADCPYDEGGPDALPCSPKCADCLCGPGSRVPPEPKLLTWELPRELVAAPSSAPADSGLPPQESPALDGLLRPPRA